MRLQRLILFAGVLAVLIGLSPPGRADVDATVAAGRKTVLVLNSYHWGDAWTDAQVSGIMQVLRAASAAPEVFLEHLDVLRQPAAADDGLTRAEDLSRRFGGRQFDLVIVTDDPALAFALRHRKRLFPAAAIVFSDALDFDPMGLPPDVPITGVRERVDIAATLAMARQLQPDARRVVVFGNRGGPATGYAHAAAALRAMPESEGVELHVDLDVERIASVLAGVSPRDIVIPLATATDRDGHAYDYGALINLISRLSPAPVFGIIGERVRAGLTVGGCVLDGEAEGRLAAEMALRILDGTPAGRIPVVEAGCEGLFSYPVMQRFGIPERRLPAGSTLVGKPPGLYDQYRGVVWAMLAGAALLLAVIVSLGLNIRHRRRVEAALEQSEEHLRLALEGATDGVWDWNLQTGAIYVSPQYYTLLGYEPGGFPLGYDTWRSQIHPDDLEATETNLQRYLDAGETMFRAEFRMRTRDGRWRWILSRGGVVARDASGRAVRIAGAHSDITEARAGAQRIASALAEKEVLLKEIYHRVKNNLQVVASLLTMQGRDAPTPVVQAMFEDSAARVLAMSQVHEQLYQSDDLASIDFGHYLGQLVQRLDRQYARQGVRLEAQLQKVVLGIETAIPSALIVNELVANAVKHAFPDGRAGRVRIGLVAEVEAGVRLTVEDDGVGLPAAFEPQAQGSLGWRLVAGLVNQLGGRFEQGGGPLGGTLITIRFRATARESRRYAGALAGRRDDPALA